jgi:hypothetical protein
MEMAGYWIAPSRYRFKHPLTGRSQDIIFDGKPREEWEKVIRARRPYAEKELSKAVAPGTPATVSRKYNINRTAFSNDVYNDLILTGKVEPCPDPGNSRYFFSK